MSLKKLMTVALCLLLLATACGQEEKPQTVYYSFKDDLGNTISLENKPQKVAALFSSLADAYILAGGRVDISVGEAVERGILKEDTALVDSGAGKTVNTELLFANRPDFVICSADIPAQTRAAEMLNQNNIPAACFRLECFEDYMRVMKILSDITGDTGAYSENAKRVQNEITELKNNLKMQKTEILFIRAGSTQSSVKAKSSEEHFAAKMLAELGCKNIADDVPVLLDSLSSEEIIKRNPKYIFISTMGEQEAARQNVNELFKSEKYRTLDAVKNQRVVFLPKELFQYKPNAKWAEAYSHLVNILYAK